MNVFSLGFSWLALYVALKGEQMHFGWFVCFILSCFVPVCCCGLLFVLDLTICSQLFCCFHVGIRQDMLGQQFCCPCPVHIFGHLCSISCVCASLKIITIIKQSMLYITKQSSMCYMTCALIFKVKFML